MIPDIQVRVTGGRKKKEEAMKGYLSILDTTIGHWFIDPTEPPGKQYKLCLGVPCRQWRKKRTYVYWLPSLIG